MAAAEDLALAVLALNPTQAQEAPASPVIHLSGERIKDGKSFYLESVAECWSLLWVGNAL